MAQGTWGYVFSYRVHSQDGDAWEVTGRQLSPGRDMSELELQEHVLSCLGQSLRDDGQDVRDEDLVITRFSYATVPPVLVPDIEQAGQDMSRPDRTAPDTD